MEMERKWAMPNKWTFKIKPIAKLIEKYVGDGKGWVDPFAGENSPAEFTNDLNPEMPTKHHLDAIDYCNLFDREFDGIIFDPPYSYEQITRSYKGVGLKARAIDTSGNFYARVKDALRVVVGGYVISFGWNSCGFGKKRGFEIVEILLVCHGGDHNDTIVTVEKKMQGVLNADSSHA